MSLSYRSRVSGCTVENDPPWHQARSGSDPAVSPVSPQPFKVSLEDHGRVVVVRVQGEVDTATAPRMGQVVDAQLARERRVVLDLSRVDFMDLHGLAVLIRAARRDRTRFVVAHPAQCVLRLLELIHADGEVPILPDGTDPLEAA